MMNITNSRLTPKEEELTRNVYQVVLLKIKACILKNLEKDDIPEFERVIESKNMRAILDYANAKIPNLSKKISGEIGPFISQLNLIANK